MVTKTVGLRVGLSQSGEIVSNKSMIWICTGYALAVGMTLGYVVKAEYNRMQRRKRQR